MSLYERFKDTKEAGFREEFVRPLLIRLGFVGITNKHGSQEFGKDYVFSELDRFGQLRHMVVQAKHEEKIEQGTKVDGLVSQIRQAFNTPYTLPNAPSEVRHVAAVYVFNSGGITDNAEKQIRDALPQEQRANTHCFSGHQLESWATAAAIRHDSDVRVRLMGLSVQLKVNCEIWEAIRAKSQAYESEEVGWDNREGLLHAVEQWITYPMMLDRIPLNRILHLWQAAKIIRACVAKHYARSTKFDDKVIEKEMEILAGLCTKACDSAVAVRRAIAAVLSELPPTTI
jgi:hypothetical protein